MDAKTIRVRLIALLVVAAIVSAIGTKTNEPLVGWVGFAFFLCAVFLYVRWRRAVVEQRGGRVFDREAKTDETGPRPDRQRRR
jgi:hypothetical protein